MAEKLQVTIIGLGLLGASAGLALRRYPEKVRVVGHDRDAQAAAKAKQMGAVERTEWNLINAVSDADRILLALPLSEERETLKAIAADLRPGCVILNMTPVNTPASRWAAELLPPGVHFVGGRPIIIAENVDTDGARADLFQNKLFCLTPDTHTSDSAANLAADLVDALGARPFFLDPDEHDGFSALVEQLPLLLSGALLKMASEAGSWRDMRKLAGSEFYTATLLASDTPAAAASALVANRENVLRWLDSLVVQLDEWRALMEAGDEAALTAAFEQGQRARAAWLNAQATGDWDQEASPEIPTTGNYLRGLLGLRGLERAGKKGK